MCSADLDDVSAAEIRSHLFPWTRGNFSDSLAAGHGAWVALEDGQMTAYAITMHVLEEEHLLNITVLPELQRCGRGSQLLSFLFDQARLRASTRMLLEVRPGNVSAQALYRRHGFVEIGRRRDYYPVHEGREDAIVMARDVSPQRTLESGTRAV